REQRTQQQVEKGLAQVNDRYPGFTAKWTERGPFLVEPAGSNVPKGMLADLKKLELLRAERRLKDRTQIQGRLDKIRGRYPLLETYYEVELRDTDTGTTLFWQRKEYFCAYTRELTVDLPDVDKVNLSEQGEEEYCENCGRPMVLKKGRFGTF